ncbi:aminotransferase class I/II-fold pyridoxal phosphate-dependent enzyme [Thermoproteota archaeon]
MKSEDRMKSRFSSEIDKIPPSGIRRFFDLVIDADDVISLGVGEPDFVTPWTVCDEAIYCLEQGLTSYTANNGLLECRQEISEYLKRRFHCDYDPKKEIIVTVGVSEAVDITFRSILNKDDEVILQEPTYVCYAPLIQLAGGKPVRYDTSQNDFLIDPAELEKLITPKTKAVVLCSPNNPTGRVIPKDILIEIGKLAEKYDFWIISDEIYAELTYDMVYTSMASLPGLKHRTILYNGFSKAFAMTGWRIGYVCGPKPFIERALKIHQYCTLCAPIISQYAAIEALRKCKNDVLDMNKSYLRRRNFFVTRLNEIGLSTTMPEGAFYCFPSIKNTGLSSEDFALRLLEKERVAVVPGNVFGAGGEGYVRCCYATSQPLLREALKRIERFVKRKGKSYE